MNRILSEEGIDELQAAKRGRLEAENWKAINPLWRLADPLNVQQAAALIAGFDPNVVRFNSNDAAWFESEGFTDSGGIGWVQTAFAALTNAVLAGKLRVKIAHDARPVDEADEERFADMMECGDYFSQGIEIAAGDGERYINGYFVKDAPNWARTMIGAEEIREWLKSKGFCTGFFFATATDAPDYLDPKNPRYAPKLAAAMRAWQSVTDAGGKHPKQALAKWLREHAAEFGMTDDEGKPNETGIEEAAKVANWQPGGGAPKTPGE